MTSYYLRISQLLRNFIVPHQATAYSINEWYIGVNQWTNIINFSNKSGFWLVGKQMISWCQNNTKETKCEW